MFGAFSVGQASMFGPDIPLAKKSGAKIFEIIKEPSQINAIEEFVPPVSTLKGIIEFKDVWFRYPTNSANWVFKGLNLTINQNECVAIVGESGQGKSTLISLIMRFYDPEFGEVFIDG